MERRNVRRAATLGTIGTAVFAAVLVLGTGAALAGKPPPAPADTGWIYYYQANGWTQRELWVMDPEGGSKAKALPSLFSKPAAFPRPTHALHGGKRWFLDLRPVGTDCYGTSAILRHEYFAVTAAGDSVQLTSSTDLQPNCSVDGEAPHSVGWWCDMRLWAANGGNLDGKISFLACRWVGGSQQAAGLYTLDISWTNDVPAAVGVPALVSTVPVSTWYDAPAQHYQMGLTYDWSPDGTKVVTADGYGTDPGLYCQAVASTSRTLLVGDGWCGSPVWSSAGKIAFGYMVTPTQYARVLQTINPDGSGRKTIVNAPSDADSFIGSPHWSPQGTYLVYSFNDNTPANARAVFTAIYRVTADGGSRKTLASTTASQGTASAICWEP